MGGTTTGLRASASSTHSLTAGSITVPTRSCSRAAIGPAPSLALQAVCFGERLEGPRSCKRGIPMSPNQADPVLAKLPGLLPELETLYTDLHAHPELSLQETRTAGLAAERLRGAGYEVTTGVGKTGVVGLLRNGAGPTVMLRADMDALPIAESTGFAYASRVEAEDAEGNTVPVGHMCGHDMHVAWLVGAATLLAQARGAWKGALMAVFQPGEETAQGAQAMIDDG